MTLAFNHFLKMEKSAIFWIAVVQVLDEFFRQPFFTASIVLLFNANLQME
jgi:hypothetical protein